MIAVYGDNCIDRYVRPRPADFVGGNAVNVAVHLAAQGAPVAYFGITGDDPEGDMVRQTLTARGVDCEYLEARHGATAVTWIEVREGERIVLDDRVGVQCPLRLSPKLLGETGPYRFVHCTAFTAWNIAWRDANPDLVQEVERLAHNSIFVSLDFSELEHPELAALLGKSLGVAFVSRGPDCSSTRLLETFRFFHDCGIPEVVITLGAAGAACSDADGVISVPAQPITPVDTLGAGDAFIAGWLFGRANGEDRRRCMERGTDLAAEVCAYFGAWPQEIRHAGTANT